MSGRIFCHLASLVGEFTTEPIVRFLRHVDLFAAALVEAAQSVQEELAKRGIGS